MTGSYFVQTRFTVAPLQIRQANNQISLGVHSVNDTAFLETYMPKQPTIRALLFESFHFFNLEEKCGMNSCT